jgi:hypothetical protein
MSKGLKLEHKLLIFFGGIFIMMFSGFNYFRSIPGITKKEKNEAIIIYYLGMIFWVGGIISLYHLL